MNQSMHIAFCVNDNYVKYITVTIKSLIENNLQHYIYIYIAIDILSMANRVRLEKLISEYNNIKLEILLVNDAPLKSLKNGNWPIQIWYRILLPQLLPSSVKKVLYLDADTLVITDLQELFSLDMSGIAIAASMDIQSFDQKTFDRCGYEYNKQYICSGILLMNLEYWRKNNLTHKILEWANQNNNRIQFPDQDAINYICRDSKIILPLRYGILNAYFYSDNFYHGLWRAQLKDCIEKPVLIHYAGCYPWIKGFSKHIMYKEWFKYNEKLKDKIKVEYLPSNWLFFKIIIWRILHPFKKQKLISIDKIKKKLS